MTAIIGEAVDATLSEKRCGSQLRELRSQAGYLVLSETSMLISLEEDDLRER